MDYIEVSFYIEPFSTENAEIVEAIVSDLGFESFAIDELPSGSCSLLKGYIPIEEYSAQIKQNLKVVLDGLEGLHVTFETNFIKEQNWNLPWEEQFSPIVVDKLCTVKAEFHKDVKRTRFNITIKPNMAFGTGHHQTTTLMMRVLLRLGGIEPWSLLQFGGTETWTASGNMIKGKQILDMGTGTGILAILAAKLGASRPVHAIDIDATAVNSAKENLWKNRLHKAVTALYGDASLIQASKYNIILANINRNILLDDLSTYCRGLKPGGIVIMSGFYSKDIQMLVAKGRKLGMKELYRESYYPECSASEIDENWSLLILGKD